MIVVYIVWDIMGYKYIYIYRYTNGIYVMYIYIIYIVMGILWGCNLAKLAFDQTTWVPWVTVFVYTCNCYWTYHGVYQYIIWDSQKK